MLRRALVGLAVGVTAMAAIVAVPSPASAVSVSPADIYVLARWGGFSRDQAATMTAIALAESGGNSSAHNTSGEDSRGLWQINVQAHPWAATMNLFDPLQNALAAYRVSNNGQNMSPWTVTHGSGSARYLQFRGAALAGAVSHGAPITSGVWTGSPGYATVVAPGAAEPVRGGGYWMVDAGGAVYDFGDAFTSPFAPAAVSVATRRDGSGIWILDGFGQVHVRGTAQHFGNVPPGSLAPGEAPTTIAARPGGDGYWVFTSRGRALAFGAARAFGDMVGIPLNGAVIASAPTPTGNGYWMVGSDGGIFSFGDARFFGSTGGLRLNRPVVGIAADPDGVGYWLIASDGGIFAFDAPFKGSLGSIRLNRPVIGGIAYGDGYLMVGSDGGIFAFSAKLFLGSLGGAPPAQPVTGVAAFAT